MGMLQDTLLDRREVQDIVHEALGRQLRLAMVAGVLMIVVGFVLGHYVAAAHSRVASDRLEQRMDELIAHVGALQRQSLEQQAAQRTTLETLAALERLRRDQAARDREALQVIIAGAVERRTACLRELEPFAKRRLMVPTPQVVAVVNEFVDRQVGQVQQLLAVVERRVDDAAVDSGAAPHPAPPPPSEPFNVSLDRGTRDAAEPCPAPPPPATAHGVCLPLPAPPATAHGVCLPLPAPPATAHGVCLPLPAPPAATAHGVCLPQPGKLTMLPDVTLGLGARKAADQEDGPHFAPAQRSGYLFFAPSQPRRLDEVRVADPEVIPLPPR